MSRIYIDHAATTPVDPRVLESVIKCLTDQFGNPSSIHAFGREAKAELERARELISSLLNCSPESICFTSGGTEADNLALIGYVSGNPARGRHIIVSNIEHPAVREAASELENHGISVTRAAADRDGVVHPDAVEAELTADTCLVSVMHANNEVGTVNDIGAIGRMLRERGVAFHTDAVQTFGKIPIDAGEMCIDLLSLSSHKIYGPKGAGALFIRDGVEVAARHYGGSQERGLRTGTENLPGIVGLGRAAEICAGSMADESVRLTGLSRHLLSIIRDNLADVTLNGHPERRVPGSLSLTFEGIEGEALLIALDLEGIAASAGSACSSGSVKPSPVLTALGMSDEQAHSTLRFTLGRGNTHREIERAGEVIVREVNRLRAMND